MNIAQYGSQMLGTQLPPGYDENPEKVAPTVFSKSPNFINNNTVMVNFVNIEIVFVIKFQQQLFYVSDFLSIVISKP